MSSAAAKPVSITVSDATRVSGLLQKPPRARACYVLAHGAGAGMDHPFMDNVARGLASRGIATMRYQFPYMERGGKRPDPPPLAQTMVRSPVAAVHRLSPDTPLIAVGKSFGNWMTSQSCCSGAGIRRRRIHTAHFFQVPLLGEHLLQIIDIGSCFILWQVGASDLFRFLKATT